MSSSTAAALTATPSAPIAGHPWWHFAIVAAAAVLTFAVIKAAEWWRHAALRMRPPSLPLIALAALSLACSVLHAWVCPEHFREWVVYGVFFVCASTLQAGWAVLIVARPNARLLFAGVAGNAVVVVTYMISRTVGIPFGPDAFHPENINALGIAATTCELAAEALAAYLVIRPGPRPLAVAVRSTVVGRQTGKATPVSFSEISHS